jgi:quercetin dioxygenase-like cupin family protein
MNHLNSIINRGRRAGPVAASVTALLLAGSAAALAQDHKAQVTAPDAIQWGPAPAVLPKGAQAAVLSGDPGKAGPFTVRLKMPGGYRIAAHQHPTGEAVTVISGEFKFGMGDKLDESKAQTLGPGGFVDLPANMNHFGFTTSDTVVQINSSGPFVIKYVNPADDPSRTQ